MSVLDVSSVSPTTASPTAVQPRPGPVGHSVAARRVVAIATIAVLVGLLAAVVLELFEGPLASEWYTTRQHQLASQLAASRPHTGRGAAIALLQIPVLGVNLVVAEGDTPQQLRSGPGHRIGTPFPGAVGNSVIVGHSRGWGGPLSDLARVKPGDHIALETGGVGGPIGVFQVQSVRRVGGNDLSPFAGSTDRRLTIVTGTGGRYSDRRLVVTAVSGPVGRVTSPPSTVHASTSPGSLLWNGDVLLAFAALAAGAALCLALRRRYRAGIVAVVVTPLFMVGLLAFLLNIDAALPPLR
jgi:LPXTG-site transpeptidase (sortase) family protein